jgi:2-keto-4-pentenoate hydratase
MSLDRLADALASARAEARTLDAAPWLNSVASVADGYAVQTLLAQRPGHEVRGWKVTALVAEQQRLFSSDRPVAGALLAPFVHAAPAKLSLKSYVTPLLECEVAFLLGADLPARVQPYTRADIEAAVEAVVPAMEIADCRWPAKAPDLLKLADSMGNGAFIAGAPLRDWRKLDLTGLAVTLSLDGSVVDKGSSARILGNPLLAVIALANAQPLPADGLKCGQIVTTGTCTTPLALREGRYSGDFGPLGSLQIDVA